RAQRRVLPAGAALRLRAVLLPRCDCLSRVATVEGATRPVAAADGGCRGDLSGRAVAVFAVDLERCRWTSRQSLLCGRVPAVPVPVAAGVIGVAWPAGVD